MECKVVNQVHIVLEGPEVYTFVKAIKKLSKKRPSIGFSKSGLDKDEIELMQKMESILCPDNEPKEQ